MEIYECSKCLTEIKWRTAREVEESVFCYACFGSLVWKRWEPDPASTEAKPENKTPFKESLLTTIRTVLEDNKKKAEASGSLASMSSSLGTFAWAPKAPMARPTLPKPPPKIAELKFYVVRNLTGAIQEYHQNRSDAYRSYLEKGRSSEFSVRDAKTGKIICSRTGSH